MRERTPQGRQAAPDLGAARGLRPASIRAMRWSNWAGDQACRPARTAWPRSVAELQEAVAAATRDGLRVRAVGSGHSFSDIALTDGLLVRMDGLAEVVAIDGARARVQAGITIRELARRLYARGLALANLGDVDAQTISGAISTATHGTGARLGTLATMVSGLTLVTADGSLLHVGGDDPELLRAARVGLGALGIVAEVTLECVPAFTLHAVDAPAPLEETLDAFDTLTAANDHFELFAFPHAAHALTRTNNRTDAPPQPRSRARAWTDDVLLGTHAFGASCRLGRRRPALIPRLNRLVTRASGTIVRTDAAHRIFSSARAVRFTEMEYALAREHTTTAVRRVLEMIDRRGFAVPFPLEVRTVAADDALLSPAVGRDSGYVAVHMFEGMAWEPYFRAVEEIMLELGGRPHWGKRHFQTAETLSERYPDWKRFAAVRARVDPGATFANAWTDRVLGPVRAPAPVA